MTYEYEYKHARTVMHDDAMMSRGDGVLMTTAVP